MVSESSSKQPFGQTGATPLGIAHNDLFTAKEKLDLLGQLRADFVVAEQEGLQPAFTLDEIDRAIAEVRQDIEAGHGTETLSRGDA